MTAHVKPPGTIAVRWRDNMFDTKVHSAYRDEGDSLLDIVESISNLPLGFETNGCIRINGHEIKREYWHCVRPRVGGNVVTFHVTPGDNKTLQTVAQIAILVASVAISAGALGPVLGPAFAGGTFASISASLVVPVGGSLAIGGL
ncbi:MAG TPA: hypothetical protein VH206_14310 [Xanthobacteraceae bacterium]|jgi:hypothetical protein|nr:hypothetical protein [Xanthobacteraceae bacterium]